MIANMIFQSSERLSKAGIILEGSRIFFPSSSMPFASFLMVVFKYCFLENGCSAVQFPEPESPAPPTSPRSLTCCLHFRCFHQ